MASTKTLPILKPTHLFLPNLMKGITSRDTTGDKNVYYDTPDSIFKRPEPKCCPFRGGITFKLQIGEGLNAVAWAYVLGWALNGLTLPLPQLQSGCVGLPPCCHFKEGWSGPTGRWVKLDLSHPQFHWHCLVVMISLELFWPSGIVVSFIKIINKTKEKNHVFGPGLKLDSVWR